MSPSSDSRSRRDVPNAGRSRNRRATCWHHLVTRPALIALPVAGWALASWSWAQQPAVRPEPAVNRPAVASAAPVESRPSPSRVFTSSNFKTLAEWKAACDRLPLNRDLRRSVAPRELLPIKSFRQFDEVVEGYFAECKTGVLSQTNSWVGAVPARDGFFNTDKVYFQKTIPFQPFAQKLELAPGSEVLFHGDLHGDVHSLLAWLVRLNQNKYLDGFTIARTNVYLVMLGDYTDRGMHGVEVLYTLFRLKLANPDRVFLLRGNHEDVTLAINYGFLAEIQAKYGREFNATKILRSYDFLPVVLYLGSGTNFIQCNHGGMEPGFDPGPLLQAPGSIRFQLLGRLNQARFLKDNPGWQAKLDPASRKVAEEQLQDFEPVNPVSPTTLGFIWNDFSIVPGEPALGFDPGRAVVYGEVSTRYLLGAAARNPHRVHAVFRAHQHSSLPNPMMRRLKASNGVFRHWQAQDSVELLEADERKLEGVVEHTEERSIPPGSVFTFNVSPDTVYGEGCAFDFDTSAVLTVREKFEDWKLRVINVPLKR